MASKYTDVPSTVQVIGNIYLNPALLDNNNYRFYEEDFTEEFHKILFGSIYNLHAQGAKEITANTIEDYLNQRPKSLAVYKANKGPDYLREISKSCSFSTFEYYYKKMKKMTLLRMYDNIGMDLTWLYDPDNILDAKKKQAQEDWLDNNSLETISDIIDKKITDIKLKYAADTKDNFCQAGDEIEELIEKLQKYPEVGYPMFGPLINSVTRGARLKKFYLRSAATGVGKTRAMIADACNFACDKIYDSEKKEWIENGSKEPTLFITTEQEVDEIQTMMLAFLSDVDEGHIIYNNYGDGELDRVVYAAKLLKNCLIFLSRILKIQLNMEFMSGMLNMYVLTIFIQV